MERPGSSKTRRPDIVLFVNGIPLCVIECKGPNEDFEEAVSQNIRNQGAEEIPQLFRSVQLLIATNKNKVQYGTVGTSEKVLGDLAGEGVQGQRCRRCAQAAART